MDWKACAQRNEGFGQSRFEWPVGVGKDGFDCNEAFTFNDVWGAVSWVWTWPGDYLLNTEASRAFFELGPGTIIGSNWSTAFGWLLLPVCGYMIEFSENHPKWSWVLFGGGIMLMGLIIDYR